MTEYGDWVVSQMMARALDKLNLLHGFGLVGSDAYVAQTPNLIVARDTNGDDRADWFRVVL